MGFGRLVVVSAVVLIFILLSLGGIIRAVFWLSGVFGLPGNPELGDTTTSILVVAFVVAFVTAVWTYRFQRQRASLQRV